MEMVDTKKLHKTKTIWKAEYRRFSSSAKTQKWNLSLRNEINNKNE